ncbi:DinB family protein [Paenibacillus sp. GSMTC-2017]|uniref:DinB family protein n=1 Tax=Paenibacillus sp. GSMTC-2017 TaxID=2794350 RepID=UPI0018DA32D5|nr:DinB family protein [Paenibacillus sp. GSMTC-2017]MBH5318439.1 DinB family protein [Paenibacillus sp. GSMTC-2017]
MNDQTCIETYKSDWQYYSLEKLRYKSGPEVWSLGQMYDHLILTALDYFEQVETCASATVEQPLGKTEAGEFIFKTGGFPPIKIKLPEGPENSPSNLESIEDLTGGLDQVLQKIGELETSVNQINPNFKVKHDGFGWLNGQEWFALVGMHFRHHLRQKSELEQQ